MYREVAHQAYHQTIASNNRGDQTLDEMSDKLMQQSQNTQKLVDFAISFGMEV